MQIIVGCMNRTGSVLMVKGCEDGMTEFIITCESELQNDGSYKIKRYRELVRCKDCKHWEQSNGHCPFNSIFTNEDWFCADGERKET